MHWQCSAWLTASKLNSFPKRNLPLLICSLFLWTCPKAVGKQLRRPLTWTNNTRWVFCPQERIVMQELHSMLWNLARGLLVDVYTYFQIGSIKSIHACFNNNPITMQVRLDTVWLIRSLLDHQKNHTNILFKWGLCKWKWFKLILWTIM